MKTVSWLGFWVGSWIFCTKVLAGGILYPSEPTKVGNIAFLDESDRMVSLSDSFGSYPRSLLVPFYAHCQSVCPTLIASVKSSWNGLPTDLQQNLHVLLVSIAVDDSAADLREVRSRFGIPQSWTLARADGQTAKEFFRALEYLYVANGKDYIHPSKAFLLEKDLTLTATLAERALNTSTLIAALETTRDIREKKGLIGTFPFLLDFDRMAIWGGLGLLFTLGMGTLSVRAFRASRKDPGADSGLARAFTPPQDARID